VAGLEIFFRRATIEVRKSEPVCKFEEAECLPRTQLAQALRA
jgi:hypothetical protein